MVLVDGWSDGSALSYDWLQVLFNFIFFSVQNASTHTHARERDRGGELSFTFLDETNNKRTKNGHGTRSLPGEKKTYSHAMSSVVCEKK